MFRKYVFLLGAFVLFALSSCAPAPMANCNDQLELEPESGVVGTGISANCDKDALFN